MVRTKDQTLVRTRVKIVVKTKVRTEVQTKANADRVEVEVVRTPLPKLLGSCY